MTPYVHEAWTVVTRFITSYGLGILGAAAIFIAGWVVAGWAGRAAVRVTRRSATLGPTLAPVLSKAVRIFVLFLVVVATLEKLGVDTTSLLTAFGALGLGIGLALKDTLADLASGIVLLILRPFEAGHDVDIGGVEGTVASIDMFETHLVGFDGVPIVLPNKKVREGRIRNYSQADRRRVELAFSIAYGADVNAAMGVVCAVLEGDERVLVDPIPIVNVVDLEDSSVSVLARLWIPPEGWFATHLDLRRKVKLALDAAGIEIPFPQRAVTILERKTA